MELYSKGLEGSRDTEGQSTHKREYFVGKIDPVEHLNEWCLGSLAPETASLLHRKQDCE